MKLGWVRVLLLTVSVALLTSACAAAPPYPASFPLPQLRLPRGSVVTGGIEIPRIDNKHPDAPAEYFSWSVYFTNPAPQNWLAASVDQRMMRAGFTVLTEEQLDRETLTVEQREAKRRLKTRWSGGNAPLRFYLCEKLQLRASLAIKGAPSAESAPAGYELAVVRIETPD